MPGRGRLSRFGLGTGDNLDHGWWIDDPLVILWFAIWLILYLKLFHEFCFVFIFRNSIFCLLYFKTVPKMFCLQNFPSGYHFDFGWPLPYPAHYETSSLFLRFPAAIVLIFVFRNSIFCVLYFKTVPKMSETLPRLFWKVLCWWKFSISSLDLGWVNGEKWH